MTYKPGDTYIGEFTTQRADSGAATDADALPSALLAHNGSDDASVTLTVAAVDTGRYKLSGTIPGSYTAGDKVQIVASATVNGVAGKAVIDSFVLDGKRVADLHDLAAGAQMDLVSAPNAAAVAAIQAGLTTSSIWSSALAGTIATNLDTPISSRLPASGYTAPDNSDVAALVSSVGTSLHTAVAAVQGQVSNLAFDSSGNVKSSPQTSVTVGGYAPGQDPATLLLVSPANKIATDAGNRVSANTTQLDGQAVSAAAPVSFAARVAAPGDAMDLVAAPSASAVAALQSSLATAAAQATMLTELASVKAQTDQFVFSGTSVLAAPPAGSITAATFASGAIAAGALAATATASIADALLDRSAAIDGQSPRAAWRIMAAALAGQVAGAGTNNETFLGLDGATTRLAVEVDGSGNRTAVTYP